MASSKALLHPQNAGGLQQQQQQRLGRQGSILSLTLEELQNSMLEQGKIGSMNMDEFMKNVWSAEENQAAAAAALISTATAADSIPALHRQPSVSIPRTLCQKTVDEVWKEIQVHKQQQQNQNPELSYGEITLEDFLIRAGVVKEDTEDPSGVLIGPQGTLEQQQQEADWFNFQVKQQQQQMLEAGGYAKRSPVGNLMLPSTAGGGGYYDGPYDGDTMTPGGMALSPGVGTPGTPGNKRSLDMVVEKTVERRQRRMIKNRESAARSRARKQAYTVELEAEVTQLKEENTRLKRWQAEEAERRRKQITEIFLPMAQQQQEQSIQQRLRRCRSFP